MSLLAPEEQLRVLEELCHPGFTRRQLQVIGASVLGYSTQETALGLSIAPATVTRHLQILEFQVFESSGLAGSRQLLIAWSILHRNCCTAPCWRMIEKRQLFDHPMQPLRRVA
jgi:hypothetical protein